MTIEELIQEAQLQNNRAFRDIQGGHARAIVRSALEVLRKKISALEDEKLIVAHFGTFIARSIGKEGNKLIRPRIHFRVSEGKVDRKARQVEPATDV